MLIELLKRLQTSKMEFCLVGGMASIHHGVSVLTREIDICCPFTLENLKKLEKAIEDLNPWHRPRRDLKFEATAELAKSLKNLYLETNLGPLGCHGEIAGVGGYDEVAKQSEEAKYEFGTLKVISIPALIRAKEAIGRPHDFQTSAQLRAILERKQQEKV